MFCVKCGGQIPEGAVVCPYCGTPVQSKQANQDGITYPGTTTPAPPAQETMAPKAVAGFICSILGMITVLLPFVNLALSIVGTCLCKKSLGIIKANPAVYSGGSLASVGHVFGIIGIVLNSIVVFVTIVWGIAMGGGLFAFSQLL